MYIIYCLVSWPWTFQDGAWGSIPEATGGCIPYKLSETKVLLRGKQNAQFPASLTDFSEMPANLADILKAITCITLRTTQGLGRSHQLSMLAWSQSLWNRLTTLMRTSHHPRLAQPSSVGTLTCPSWPVWSLWTIRTQDLDVHPWKRKRFHCGCFIDNWGLHSQVECCKVPPQVWLLVYVGLYMFSNYRYIHRFWPSSPSSAHQLVGKGL